MANNPITILIIDDEELVAHALSLLCTLVPNVNVVGVTSDSREGIARAFRLRPDIALVDLSMPNIDGLGVAARFRQAKLPTKVIILTGRMDEQPFRKAMELGVAGYILKCSPSDELKMAITNVARGKPYIAQEMISLRSQPKSAPELSLRHREILQLIVEGKTSKEIAHILGLACKTVEHHRAALMRSMKVSNASELSAKAITMKMICTLTEA